MLIFLLVLFFILFVLFSLGTIQYANSYPLIMVFGKKGSGKTTYLAKLAYKYTKLGKNVYSNVHLPNVYLIEDKDVGHKMLPPDSVLLFDEAGMQYDNRKFKNFDDATRNWFKLQRHYKVRVYLFSQTFDVDKKLRDLTDEMLLVERRFRVFSYGRRIIKKVTLTEASVDKPSRIDENLKFDSFLFFWCGSRTLTLIPRWAGSFDSFDAPPLPAADWPIDHLDWQPVPSKRVWLDILRWALWELRAAVLLAIRGFLRWWRSPHFSNIRKYIATKPARPDYSDVEIPQVSLEDFFDENSDYNKNLK